MSPSEVQAALDAATAAYLANRDYDVVGSAAKCGAFVVACRDLLMLRPIVIKHGGAGEMQFNAEMLQEQLAAAQKWLRANGGAAGGATAQPVRFASFEDFR